MNCPRCGHSTPDRGALLGICPGCLAHDLSRPETPEITPPVPDEAAGGAPYGRYLKVKELGRGGMGEVWKAWDTVLGRWVALKFLKGDADELPRFLREARIAGALTHPGIAAVYETGEAEGRPYIALQYLEGLTLESFPRKDRGQTVALVRDAALAMEYAHSKGVIHRDLKPSNMMAVPSSETPGRHRVCIMDFGLARPIGRRGDLSQTGVVLGTPAYMSPEQARGEELDARSDVYGLGATLYDLLTGRPPFSGRDVYEVLERIRNKDPWRLRRLSPDTPQDLETIVLKCLEKDPGRRYSSARALADDLTRFLEGKPIEARPPSVAYHLGKWIRRNSALSTAYAAAVIALAVAGVLFTRAVLEQGRLDKAEKASLEADLERARERERERERLEATKKAALEAAVERAREREREAEVVKKALERSEGLRLAAHSVGVLASNPTLSLILAVEAGKRSTALPVQNALRSSLDALREIKTLPTIEHSARGSFSRDGTLLLTVDRAPRLWDARTGELRRTFPMAYCNGAALSPDKRRLLTVDTRTIWEVWDAGTGKLVAECRRERQAGESRVHERAIGQSPFTPDSKSFVVPWQDRAAAMIGVETGKPALLLKGHEGKVLGVNVSPDGAKVVTWSEDQTVRVWNAADGTPIATISWLKGKQSGGISEGRVSLLFAENAFFSPDSRLLMISTMNGSKVWRLEPVAEEYDLGAMSRNADFSPDGKMLLSYGSGDQFAFVRIHDLQEKKVSGTLRGHQKNITSACFSPSGRWILTSSFDRTARIWETATANEVAQLPGHPSEVRGAEFSPDENMLYTSTRSSGHLWHLRTEGRRRSISGTDSTMLTMALSPDGTKIAAPCDYNTTQIWDLETKTLTLDLKYRVGQARFSPDGRSIVGSMGSTVGIWDSKTGERQATLSGHQDGLLRIEGTRTADTLITTGRDGRVLVWDVPGRRLAASLQAPRAYFASATLSPDGTMLATPEKDRIVALYDFPALTRRKEFTGHTDAIQSIGWSPDGRWLYSLGRDSVIKVWNIATAEPRLTIPVEQYLKEPRFTPDSRTLLVMTASTASAAVELWDIPDARRLYSVKEPGGMFWNWATASDMGRFLICSGTDALLFEVRTGNHLRKLSVPTGAYQGWFHPDGKRILFTSGSGLSIVDSESGEYLGSLAELGQILEPEFSPDGKRVLISIWGRGLALHDVKVPDKDVLFTDQTAHQVWDIEFSRDGKRLVTASGLAQVWDAETGNRVLTLGRHPGALKSARFSSDGSRILTRCDKSTIMIWDAADGKKLLERGGALDPINEAEFVGGTAQVIAVHHDGRAVLHDDKESKPLPTESSVLQARADPSGTRVLLLDGSEKGPRERGRYVLPKRSETVRIWDLAQGREILKLVHQGPVSDAFWIAEGRQLATLESAGFTFQGRPWRLHLWDAQTGKEIRQFSGAGAGTSFMTSRDGKHLFAGVRGMESGTTGGRLFDLQAGIERASFPPNDAWVEALFTADGSRFITRSNKGQIKIHPVNPIDEARTLLPRELTAEEMEQYEVGTPEDRVRRLWESLDLVTRDLQTALAFQREQPQHEAGASFAHARLSALKARLSEPGFQGLPPLALRQVLEELRSAVGSRENLKKALDEVDAALAALQETKKP